MFQLIIDRLRQRHFWRRATFNELSALYVSELMREIAKNLAMVFIYAFLFTKGYSLFYLATFAIYHRLMMLIFGVFSMFLVAFFGAKKCLIVGNFFYVPSLLMFAIFDQWGELAVALGGLLIAFASEIHRTSYNVLFSEVKNAQNSGKEISYMLIFQKIAGIISPFLGGWLASYFGAESSMFFAAILYLIAAISFVKTPAQSKRHHNLNFKTFPWRSYRSIFFGQFGRGFDAVAADFWSLFVAIFILSGAATYGIVGSLKSLDAFVIFMLAFFLGRALDKQHRMTTRSFRLGVVLTSCSFIFQPLLLTLPGAIISEIIYSIGTILYHIPYTKARYDAADQSGSRVLMELMMTIVSGISAVMAGLILLACLRLIPDQRMAFIVFFVICGFANLIFAFSNFPIFRAYKYHQADIA
ncbi:MAG: MFS transporter [Candidatus Saccharibacteria bacterium]|nr:MFS transporter [Candidatus Saccharibacteria bacterium]